MRENLDFSSDVAQRDLRPPGAVSGSVEFEVPREEVSPPDSFPLMSQSVPRMRVIRVLI